MASLGPLRGPRSTTATLFASLRAALRCLRRYAPRFLPDHSVGCLWLKTITELKSFKAVTADRANYTQDLIAFYEVYAQGGGQKDVAIVK